MWRLTSVQIISVVETLGHGCVGIVPRSEVVEFSPYFLGPAPSDGEEEREIRVGFAGFLVEAFRFRADRVESLLVMSPYQVKGVSTPVGCNPAAVALWRFGGHSEYETACLVSFVVSTP